MGLLKLTADDGLQTRKIHFTRYELLRILRWTTEGRSYTRLQNALDRLSGVRIKATNAFYDNETKLHSTRNFGIIDAYEINDGRDTQPSFFTWSEVLFKSFQVGFIKKLDLDFYLELESAVSKRLYRYLDKHFWYRSRMQVNLFTLAHEKIGVSRNYVYASSLRQQLEPALIELKEKGIISEYEFIGKGKSTEIILVAAHAPKKIATTSDTRSFSEPTSEQANKPQFLRNATGNYKPDESKLNIALADDVTAVMQALVERGLAEKQALRLTAGQGSATLDRMRAIVAHFDALRAANSPLVSRSPTGFLYRAVERPFEFVLPGEKRQKSNVTQGRLDLDSQHGDHRNTGHNHSGAKNPKVSVANRSTLSRLERSQAASQKIDLEVNYLIARKARLDVVLEESRAEDKDRIRADVELALQKLKAHISPQRFVEAVQHGVEQRLLEQAGFPDFEAWVREQG